MNKRILVSLVCTLLIGTALTAVGNMNENENILSNKLVTPISLDDVPIPKSIEGKEILLTAKISLVYIMPAR